jgi:hypothetical protein
MQSFQAILLPLNLMGPVMINNQSEMETVLPLNLVGFATIKNQSEWHSTNRKRMQCFFIFFCHTLNIQTITKKNLCRSTVAQTWVFNQNLSLQVKRQTVVNN